MGPKQHERLHQALLAAFNHGELERIVRHRLGVRLENVVKAGPFEAVVFDLIEWAERTGKVEELVRAAQEGRPGHREVLAIADELLASHPQRPLRSDKFINQVVAFLRSTGLMQTTQERQAVVARAALDEGLRARLRFDGDTEEFLSWAVTTLMSYGSLADGRNALEAFLEPLKALLGPDGKENVNRLIADWRRLLSESGGHDDLLPPPSPPSADQVRLVEVFYSYSYKDEKLREQLEIRLALLKRQGVIADWHNRKITEGAEWRGQIDERLGAANIILLLVSSHFLASDYCYDVEMARALNRHERGEARVIPIIIQPVDWKSAPFAKLQVLPKDGKPVTKWSNRDEAFLNITEGIRRAAELHATPQAAPSQQGPSATGPELGEEPVNFTILAPYSVITAREGPVPIGETKQLTPQAPLADFVRKEEDGEVAARRIGIRVPGRKD